ncbi:MAG: S8 family serine peptidase [Candidatus Kerfeldbacteria bacterium]|nr:S8 family serine peptidase [Candidatus Kerfeldbacteria bacterium]
MKKTLLFGCILLTVQWYVTLPVSAAPMLQPEYDTAIPHEIIVKWSDTLRGETAEQKLERATRVRAAAFVTNNHITIKKDYARRNFSVVTSPTLSSQELIDTFSQLPQVEYAQENMLFHIQAQTTPWGIGSAGVNATAAHTSGYTGNGILVAIIDTGADIDHEDLDANFWHPNNDDCVINGVFTNGGCPNGGYDIINGDNNPNDDNGHGTHVTGILAAEDNATGVVGVAPSADIMAIKVLDADGAGDYADIIDGIDFAIDNGADIINMSLGAMSTGTILQDFQEAINDAEAAGIPVIAASGNYASNVQFIPASLESVIAVGAVQETTSQDNPDTDYNTRHAYFSNWGKVTVAAPGSRINSTTNDGSYSGDTWDGTSMAAPHVAGVVALLKQKNSALTTTAIRNVLEHTATDLGDTGKDEFFGSGLANAETALAALDDASTQKMLLEANWSDNSSITNGIGYELEPTVYSNFLPADGSTTSLMRVRVMTANGTPINGAGVNLATTAGTMTSGATVTTGSDGTATFTLQAPETAGDATVTATINATAISSSVVIHFADTLLITDAGQPVSPGIQGWYYISALNNLGIHWKASPQAYAIYEDTLSSYTNVVWHTDEYNLNANEQTLMKNYLDGGGNMFVSGGDILYTYYYYSTYGGSLSLSQDIVLSPYFNVSYANYIAPTLTFVGSENFDGTGALINNYGSTNANFGYTDVITAESGGTAMGYFCSTNDTALVTVNSTYKSAFLGIALEEVSKTDREEIMQNALNFLNGNAASGGTFTIPDGCDGATNGSGSTDGNNSDNSGEEPIPGIPDDQPEEVSNTVLFNLNVDSITTTTATISWETDEAITSSVMYAKNTNTGDIEVRGTGDMTTASIEGLTPNTNYEFLVYGLYADETSTDASSITDTTLPLPPETPSLVSKTRRTITVSLNDSANTGYAFRVELSDSNNDVVKTKTLEAGETTTTFRHLHGDTNYDIRTQLVYTNSDSEEVTSTFSDTLTVTTPAGMIVQPKIVQRGNNYATISWKKPNGGGVKKYRVQLWVKQEGKYKLLSTQVITKKLKRKMVRSRLRYLTPQTHYRVKLRALFTNSDIGPWSSYRKFSTR